MQFRVPQFIEVESKIFGPLTIKQFVYLAGGAGLCSLIWFFIEIQLIRYMLIMIVAPFSLALAFYKMNEKPFIEVLEAAFMYMIHDKLFLWKKEEKKIKKKEKKPTSQPLTIPRLSGSSLRKMTWDLDVRGEAVEEEKKPPKEKLEDQFKV